MCVYQDVRNISYFRRFFVYTKWMTPKIKPIYETLAYSGVYLGPFSKIIDGVFCKNS